LYVIGLTGGIATGKSLVSGILARLGAIVLDIDKVGHQIIEPGQPAYEEIIKYFGTGVLHEKGRINRKKLGKIVFSDPDKLKILNKITHPRIVERTAEILNNFKREYPESVIVIEAALLIEMGMQDLVDELWVVMADRELRIKRLQERNGFDREEAVRRINSQMPVEDKIAFADKVIYNSGDAERTREQVINLWRELSRRLWQQD